MGYDGSLKFDTEIIEEGFNKGITKLGSLATKGLAVVGAAMGTCSVAAIKVGASFEAEMSKVSAISGATGDDLTALSEKAKEMGSKTKFSATESAQAMEYMAMAGWKTGDMLNGIEGIMNLAAASGEDLAATSDIVTDALTAFGLSAADSTHFADVLAQASSNANTNVGMMGETFKYVAPIAGALGYSAEDTAVAIGLMANSGIKAGQAGTSLRSIMSRMAKPTKEVQTAMNQLGISMIDSNGNMKSLDTIMQDLRNSFSGLSEAQKAEMAASLGGQEAMSGLLAIVNASDKDFNKLKDSIYNADGAAEKMAATMQDNLIGQITILKSSAEGLGIEIYESVQEPLTGLAKVGIDALNELTEAFKNEGVDGLTEAGGKIISDLLLGIASGLPRVLDMALSIIQSITTNIDANIPSLVSSGGKILLSLAQGITTLLPTLGSLAMNLVLQIANGITANAPKLIPKATELILKFVRGIVSNLPKLAEAGLNMLVSLAEGVANSLPTLIAEVPKIINEFCAKLDSFIPKIIAAGVKILLALGKGIIQSIPTIIANAGEIVKAILNVITHFSLFSQGQQLIKGLGSGIKAQFSAIKNIVKSLIEKIKNPFKIDWSSIGKNIISGISSGIKRGASAIANAAKSAAKSALNAAKNFLGIHSPSTVFRDQVGKYMAKGMAVGFEKNIPTEEMTGSLEDSVNSMNRRVSVITKRQENNTKEYIPLNRSNTDPGDGTIAILETTNVFEVDSTPLVEKTTKTVIKKIDKDQSIKKDFKGGGK